MIIGPKTWMIVQTRSALRDEQGDIPFGPHLAWVKLVSFEGPDALPIFTTKEAAREYDRAANDGIVGTIYEIDRLGFLTAILQRLWGFAERFILDPKSKSCEAKTYSLSQFVISLFEAGFHRKTEDATFEFDLAPLEVRQYTGHYYSVPIVPPASAK